MGNPEDLIGIWARVGIRPRRLRAEHIRIIRSPTGRMFSEYWEEEWTSLKSHGRILSNPDRIEGTATQNGAGFPIRGRELVITIGNSESEIN